MSTERLARLSHVSTSARGVDTMARMIRRTSGGASAFTAIALAFSAIGCALRAPPIVSGHVLPAPATRPGDWSAEASESPIERVVFDPRAAHLLVLDEDGELSVWSVTSGAREHTLHVANEVDVLAPNACFSADGALVAWGVETEASAAIVVSDSRSGAERARLALAPGHRSVSLAFRGDDSALFVGEQSGAIVVLDFATGVARELSATGANDAGSTHSDPKPESIRSIQFDADVEHCAVISRIGASDVVELRALVDGKRSHQSVGRVETSAFTALGFEILARVESRAETFSIVHVASDAPRVDFDRSGPRVVRAEFTADGQRVVLANLAGSLELWDAIRGVDVATLALDGFELASNAPYLVGLDARDAVAVVDTDGGEIGETLRIEPAGLGTALALDATAHRVACGTADGRILVWLLAH